MSAREIRISVVVDRQVEDFAPIIGDPVAVWCPAVTDDLTPCPVRVPPENFAPWESKTGVIWISPAMASHAGRVKFSLKWGKGNSSFSVTLSEKPVLKPDKPDMPMRTVRKYLPFVQRWVIQNLQTLQNFWDHGHEMTQEEVDQMLLTLTPIYGI